GAPRRPSPLVPKVRVGTRFRETPFRAVDPWGARNGVSGEGVPKPEFGNERQGARGRPGRVGPPPAEGGAKKKPRRPVRVGGASLWFGGTGRRDSADMLGRGS